MVNANAEDDEHELLMAKVAALLLLFAITILMAAVPYTLNRCFKWTTANRDSSRTRRTIQCLLHFGGGVLLCTTFVYFLPEVEEMCDELIYCGIVPTLDFPLATTLMCGGFFLMYLIEECVHACFHKQHAEKANGKSATQSESSETLDNITMDLSIDNLDAQDMTPSPHAEVKTTAKCHTHSHMPTPQNEEEQEANVTASVRGALLVLALSIHEIFEGLTIGLEDSMSAVWFLFTAVAVHKAVLAFCVGMELLVSHIRALMSITYLSIYALVTPTGVLIGLAITGNNGTTIGPNLAAAILQGIACGTLVYVVFFEIISTEHLGFATFASLLLGFALMMAMLTFSEHENDDATIDCRSPTSTNATLPAHSRHIHF